MRLFYSSTRNNNHFLLVDDEFRHSVKVLRQRTGDHINIIDGTGIIYFCIIEEINNNSLSVRIISQTNSPILPYQLSIAIAPPKKSSSFEWFVEKAIEIGIHSVIPINCKRSEKTKINLDRLDKICISAMKQSKNTTKPIIHNLTNFADFIDTEFSGCASYIAYVMEKNMNFSTSIQSKKILIAIGPEGGFTESEIAQAVNKGFIPVSLGESRLRTETAGISACQIVKTVFDFIEI
jgi:16S rRNA (uracil1498-N3)-methyltransferase